MKNLLSRYWRQAGLGAFFLLCIVGAVGVGAGFYTAEESDSFCLTCHHKEGLLNPNKVTPPAHQPFEDGTKRCVECHTQRLVTAHLESSLEKTGEAFVRFTNWDWREKMPVGETDAACITCHHKILEASEKKSFELTPKLAEIGLKFDHGRHYRLKNLTPEDEQLYQALVRKQAGSVVLTDSERDELLFLEKVRRSQCSLCHERNKTAGGTVDKNVNHFTQNPMTCYSCHPDAEAGKHPGNEMFLPTESVCRRCHNGTMHGRIYFFNADKNDPDKSFCKKCHPGYQPEVIEMTTSAEDQ